MAAEPLRVMHVISNLEIGGGQEVVRTLVENLAEIGCAPVVCAFVDGPLRQDIERLGIPVEILPDRQYSVIALPFFVAEMLSTRRALLHLIDKYRIQVVQTHLLRILDLLVLTLKFSRNVRVFWTFHNAFLTLRRDHLPRLAWLRGPKQAAHRALYRLAARWVDGFIAISDGVRAGIQATYGPIPAAKIALIANSVDVRRYMRDKDQPGIRAELGLPPDARIAAVVATFKKQKGHRYLIDAAPAVIACFPNLHILFVGDGERRDELAAQATERQVRNHIHFLGLRQDVPDLLAASDCFVLPSLWEGLPMALIEAMAAGLPVIATAVSGSREVVVDGESGLLIPPADVAALEQAMNRLLADPDLAASLGQAARQRVDRHYGARKQAEEHLDLYRSELDKHGRVRPNTQTAAEART